MTWCRAPVTSPAYTCPRPHRRTTSFATESVALWVVEDCTVSCMNHTFPFPAQVKPNCKPWGQSAAANGCPSQTVVFDTPNILQGTRKKPTRFARKNTKKTQGLQAPQKNLARGSENNTQGLQAPPPQNLQGTRGTPARHTRDPKALQTKL